MLANIKDDDDLIHVGYAADGFKAYVSQSYRFKSSYVIKQGNRPSDGPKGRYNGLYAMDFEYIQSHGALDECNGVLINGEYAYILTEDFPYVPRCLKGLPDSSFEKKRGNRNTTQRYSG